MSQGVLCVSASLWPLWVSQPVDRTSATGCWLTCFTALVVIGLILEYRKDVIELFRSFEWPKLGSVIGGILVTVGVAGELFVGFLASNIEDISSGDPDAERPAVIIMVGVQPLPPIK